MSASHATREPRASRAGGYDQVVTGSGPGGATVARELARSGSSVLLLEHGNATAVTGSGRQALRELLLPGRSLHLAGSLTLLRGDTVGGSSIYYPGTAWDPPLEELARHGLDLSAEVAEIKRELRPAPLRRELLGTRARLLMAPDCKREPVTTTGDTG